MSASVTFEIPQDKVDSVKKALDPLVEDPGIEIVIGDGSSSLLFPKIEVENWGAFEKAIKAHDLDQYRVPA